MLPNFLIIGAAKSGTTSLHRYFASHPEIYVSRVKEPNFFALEGSVPEFAVPSMRPRLRRMLVSERRDYERLFDGVRGEIAIGEASSWYLHSTQAPERIAHHLRDVKLIAILRNPVDRAYSAYRMHVRLGSERAPDFAAALAEQEKRRETWNWGLDYLTPGFYHRHLQRYFDRFGASRLRVHLYEDLAANPALVVRDLFSFLGVDPDYVPPNLRRRYNASRFPGESFASDLRRAFVPWIRRRFGFVEASRNASLEGLPRRQLIEIYRDDVVRLQDLLGRDLSHWTA